MNFVSNKEKGNVGLGIAIGYFSSHGYTVSILLNDTQDYDLIPINFISNYCTLNLCDKYKTFKLSF